MFFLRCAFWLSIVYASMSWPNAEFGSVRTTSVSIPGSTLARSAAEGASGFCAKHLQGCLAGAARLTALIQATDRAEAIAGATLSATPHNVSAKVAPLPVPDPRRTPGPSRDRF